jgi:hypothetical protein
MNLKMLKMAFAGLVLSVSNLAFATIIEYNFEFQLDGSTYLTGNFTAEDSNFDNLIVDDELISMSFSNDSYSTIDYSFNSIIDDNFNFDLTAEIFSIGGISFEEGGQRWNVGAVGFSFEAGSFCAGFHLDGNFQGCDAIPATDIIQIISAVSVSGPSTLAIFALGIMGLASRRFKK